MSSNTRATDALREVVTLVDLSRAGDYVGAQERFITVLVSDRVTGVLVIRGLVNILQRFEAEYPAPSADDAPAAVGHEFLQAYRQATELIRTTDEHTNRLAVLELLGDPLCAVVTMHLALLVVSLVDVGLLTWPVGLVRSTPPQTPALN